MDLDACEVDDKAEKKEREDEQFVSRLADDARAEVIARATISFETESAGKADLCEKTQSAADGCENANDLHQALCETPKKKKRKRRNKKKKAGELTASDDVNCDVTDGDCEASSTISDAEKRNEDRSVNADIRGDHHESQDETGSKKKRRSRSRRKRRSGQLSGEVVEADTMANGETSRSNLVEIDNADEKRNMASSPKEASSGKKTPNGHGRSTEPHNETEHEQPVTFRSQERSTTPGSSSPQRTPKSNAKKKRPPLYEHYLSLEKVSEGLKKGELVKGV